MYHAITKDAVLIWSCTAYVIYISVEVIC